MAFKSAVMTGKCSWSVSAQSIFPQSTYFLQAGRLINAIGFGMVFLVSPVYIGENVRPEVRGFFLCIINGSIVLGQFILA